MDFVKKSGGSWHRDASTLHIPFPTITSPHFNRGSWHWVASALCCLYPATIAARFNWGSWHQDASALCRLFPATTAICCSRGTWHQVAIALRHCPTSSSQLGSSVLGCQHLFFPLSRQPVTNGVDKKAGPCRYPWHLPGGGTACVATRDIWMGYVTYLYRDHWVG